MISVSVDGITAAVIQRLLDNRVSERRTLEYKAELPSSSDDDKREFLYDVSSFANSSGGEVIFGVSDERNEGKPTGVPDAISAIETHRLSAELPRLENLLRDSLTPRIPGVEFHSVEIQEGQSVLVLRVPRSWIGPHMVTFRGVNRFYTRNSAGKHMMDISELRTAFALSSSLPEKLRTLRRDRIAQIESGEAPTGLQMGAKIILHFVPLTALDATSAEDFTTLGQELNLALMPIRAGSWGGRFNFDGYFTFSSGRSPARGYVQLFRSGVIEVVDSELTDPQFSLPNLAKLLPGTLFEEEIIQAFQRYLAAQHAVGVSLPIFFMLSLVGVRGYTLASNQALQIGRIDRDMLLVPPLAVEDLDVDVPVFLKTGFDSIWQASGAECSPNYNAKGKRSIRR